MFVHFIFNAEVGFGYYGDAIPVENPFVFLIILIFKRKSLLILSSCLPLKAAQS